MRLIAVTLLFGLVACGEVTPSNVDASGGDGGVGGIDGAPGSQVDAMPAADARMTTLTGQLFGPDVVEYGSSLLLRVDLFGGQGGDVPTWTFAASDGNVGTPSGSTTLAAGGDGTHTLSYTAPSSGSTVTLVYDVTQFPGAVPFMIQRVMDLCAAPCNIALR